MCVLMFCVIFIDTKPTMQRIAADGLPMFSMTMNDFPNSSLSNDLIFYGLGRTVGPGPDKIPLSIRSEWTASEVDDWLRQLLPDFFQLCDTLFGKQHGPDRHNFHWVLAKREGQKKIILVTRQDAVTGDELVRAISGVGRKKELTTLCFGAF